MSGAVVGVDCACRGCKAMSLVVAEECRGECNQHDVCVARANAVERRCRVVKVE